MGQIPKVDKKPKYNKDNAFQWVDSQWEKFMTEQKELKDRIQELEKENAVLKANSSEQLELFDYPYNIEFGSGRTQEEMNEMQQNLFPEAEETRTDEWRIEQFNRNRGPEEWVTTIEELEKSVEEMYDPDNLIEPPDAYLYESPDGGKTIYRRKSGSSEREIVEDV